MHRGHMHMIDRVFASSYARTPNFQDLQEGDMSLRINDTAPNFKANTTQGIGSRAR